MQFWIITLLESQKSESCIDASCSLYNLCLNPCDTVNMSVGTQKYKEIGDNEYKFVSFKNIFVYVNQPWEGV